MEKRSQTHAPAELATDGGPDFERRFGFAVWGSEPDLIAALAERLSTAIPAVRLEAQHEVRGVAYQEHGDLDRKLAEVIVGYIRGGYLSQGVPRCHRGHESWRLELWDCPTCHEIDRGLLRVAIALLDRTAKDAAQAGISGGVIDEVADFLEERDRETEARR